jgi:hypothetical protein
MRANDWRIRQYWSNRIPDNNSIKSARAIFLVWLEINLTLPQLIIKEENMMIVNGSFDMYLMRKCCTT